MMGYSTRSKGYKIWDVEPSKLVVSRDFIFNESSVDPQKSMYQLMQSRTAMLLLQGENGTIVRTTTLSCPQTRPNYRQIPKTKMVRMSSKMLKKSPHQQMINQLLLKLLHLFDVLLASVNPLLDMDLTFCHKHSSHKRYQFRPRYLISP